MIIFQQKYGGIPDNISFLKKMVELRRMWYNVPIQFIINSHNYLPIIIFCWKTEEISIFVNSNAI